MCISIADVVVLCLHMSTFLTHRAHEDRPWGSFDRFTENEHSTVKLIHVKPNLEFSLQSHQHRSEFWHVVNGNGTTTNAGEVREVKEGDEIEIPVGALHRLLAGPDGITILEIALGEFDEGDIVRVADDFGRV